MADSNCDYGPVTARAAAACTRLRKHAVLFAGALALLAGATRAVAGGRVHFGVNIGAPFAWDPYWSPYWRPYPPLYYPSAPVIIKRTPPVYVQRPQPAPPAAATPPTWYYCTNPTGYYPYVQTCSAPWVAVDPRSMANAPPR